MRHGFDQFSMFASNKYQIFVSNGYVKNYNFVSGKFSHMIMIYINYLFVFFFVEFEKNLLKIHRQVLIIFSKITFWESNQI